MKPVAIWLSDERGEIHPYEIKPEGCLTKLWKHIKPILIMTILLFIGYVIGQLS